MKPSTREQLDIALAAQRPLEVDLLVSENARRVTISQHLAFRKGLATRPAADELEEFLEEIRAAEFEGKGAGR